MTAVPPPVPPEPCWPSGVGGAHCDACGTPTIVRSFGEDEFGDGGEWLCLPCWRGDDDDEESTDA